MVVLIKFKWIEEFKFPEEKIQIIKNGERKIKAKYLNNIPETVKVLNEIIEGNGESVSIEQ